MRLAIYLADPSLRAAVLTLAEAYGHAVLECLPAPPPSWAGHDLYALEEAVSRLEPAVVLLDPDALTRVRRSGADVVALRIALGLPPSVALPAPAFPPPADDASPRGPVALLAVTSVEEAAAVLAGLGEVPPDAPVPAAEGLSAASERDAHADAARVVHYDREYVRLRSAARLHRPDPALRADPAAWADVLSGEEAKFVLLLQANHLQPQRRHAARAYLNALTAAEAPFEAEMAYRLPHGSWKVFWLREQACRLCAVIAHLLPGVETAHLPVPAPPLAGHQFLHWRCPVTHLYPVAAILAQAPNPTVSRLLLELFGAGFEAGRQGDEAWIADQALRLWGLCAFLRAAALAHFNALDLCLEPDSSFPSAAGPGPEMAPGPLPQPLGVLLEFWGWHGLLSVSTGLRRTAAGVRTGATYVAGADGADPLARAAYPYRAFAALMSPAWDIAPGKSADGGMGGVTLPVPEAP